MNFLGILLAVVFFGLFVYELVSLIRLIISKVKQSKINKNKENEDGNINSNN